MQYNMWIGNDKQYNSKLFAIIIDYTLISIIRIVLILYLSYTYGGKSCSTLADYLRTDVSFQFYWNFKESSKIGINRGYNPHITVIIHGIIPPFVD